MTITRRDFVATAAGTLPLIAAAPQTAAPSGSAAALDLAEWSYFWVGVERAPLARGTFTGGKQMYVEYWIPRVVRHPVPIVLVHGGGGQGTDWMGTPDGRPGWATLLVQKGYKVYVVDRPGHGRSPFHPDTHGQFPAQANSLEAISGRFTPPNPTSSNKPLPFQHLHKQWPGTGEVGSDDLDQFVASQGGSYVTVAGNNNATAVLAHTAWRERGAMLLDKIGPAVIMTHSAGGPFGWLVAEVRPSLVKGIIAIEGGGQPFGGANVWGMSTIPVAYEPPVSDPSELKTVAVTPTEEGVAPYKLQAEPARKLKNLKGIPIVCVTAEASFASPGNPGAVAYFKQAGCTAEELRLVDRGIHGNGHMMMVEKNNAEVLEPIVAWIEKNVPGHAPARAPRPTTGADSTALRLSGQGFFWVGMNRKKMPYGTILSGQMYVQYLTPSEVKHPYPVVLVHGGTGQMLHYMGQGDGLAGWAHYFAQEGYKVYLIDRPGHGRAPYHPDALGPIGGNPSYAGIVAEFRRATHAPDRRWPGSGEEGDPGVDQFMASQNAAPQDSVMAHKLWASGGAQLLKKTGPAIVMVHSAGGPFGYLVANERPQLVKAIVNVEGGGAPFSPGTPWGLTDIPLVYDPPVTDPAQLHDSMPRVLKNLQGIPMVYVTAERSGRTAGPAVAAFLKQMGCQADDLQLKDKGIRGNGHFMMFESNRRQVFDAIRGWIESKVEA
jgi:pimeloyl-ACP methyl ester carboxylesterase